MLESLGKRSLNERFSRSIGLQRVAVRYPFGRGQCFRYRQGGCLTTVCGNENPLTVGSTIPNAGPPKL